MPLLMRLGYLGPEGTYAQEAVQELIRILKVKLPRLTSEVSFNLAID